MARATYNGVVIAESDATVVVEGNHYFPPSSVDSSVLRESTKQTRCFWKGKASYYHVEVGGASAPDAAWYYPEPKKRVENIKGYIAFWRGVSVES